MNVYLDKKLPVSFQSAQVDGAIVIITTSSSLKLKSIDSNVLRAANVKSINAVLKQKGFRGVFGDVSVVTYGSELNTAVIVGVRSDYKDMRDECEVARKAGGILYETLSSHNIAGANVFLENSLNQNKFFMDLLFGLQARSYKFDKSYGRKELPDPLELGGVPFEFVEEMANLAAGAHLTCDMVNTPLKVYDGQTVKGMNNDTMVDLIRETVDNLREYGANVKVTHYTDAKLTEMKAGSILGVNRGSERLASIVRVDYLGGEEGEAPICFAPKCVMFDTGGISIKPSSGMSEMKADMAGGAAVFGALVPIARAGVEANVSIFFCIAENTINEKAIVPGDVLNSMKGLSIEVLNTDAEGRLVMADGLTLAETVFPDAKVYITVATLTGAAVRASGTRDSVAFADERYHEAVKEAAAVSGEGVVLNRFDLSMMSGLDSDFADIANMSKTPTECGHEYAALFLRRFLDQGDKLLHIDVAGPAIKGIDASGRKTFATGYGVRLLLELVKRL